MRSAVIAVLGRAVCRAEHDRASPRSRGRRVCARLSRVERPAGIAARLLSASPPCFFRCSATIASTAARCSASRSPRATRWSARRPGLVAGPGLEGGDELGLVDQAVLQGEQAEEQVMVGGVHGKGLPAVQPCWWMFVPRRRGPLA